MRGTALLGLLLAATVLREVAAEPAPLRAARSLTDAAEAHRLFLPAPNRFDAVTWRRVKIYDMQALQKVDPPPLWEVVGVRFHYRQASIRHWKPNWYQGSIWCSRRDPQDHHFDFIQVLVAAADLPAFQAIATEFRGDRSYVVYGQVLKDFDAHFTFLRLIGTKVKRLGRRGSVLVTW